MRKIIKKFFDRILIKKKIFIIYRFGSAVGDHLLITGLIRLIKQKYDFRIFVFTTYPELFRYNNKVEKVYKLKFNIFSAFFVKFLNYLNCDRIKQFLKVSNNRQIFDLSKYKDIHICNYQSLNFKLNLNFNDLKNEIYFNNKELIYFKNKFKLPEKFALIQSEGKKTFTSNREWGVHNFQSVVDEIKEIKWVQIGGIEDKILKNISFFYNGNSLRELAYIVSKSKFFVCQEGFYYHLSNSFNNKKYLIMSGFMHKKNIYYNNNTTFIEKLDGLKCYPCYKLYDCDVDGKPCTNKINPSQVIATIRKDNIF